MKYNKFDKHLKSIRKSLYEKLLLKSKESLYTPNDIKVPLDTLTINSDNSKVPEIQINNMRSRTHYSDEFKRAVVQEVLAGLITKDGARRLYGINGKSTVLNWIRNFENSKIKNTDTNEDHILYKPNLKDLQAENCWIRKELQISQLKIQELNLLIDISKSSSSVPIFSSCYRNQLTSPSYSEPKEPINNDNRFFKLTKEWTKKFIEIIRKGI